MNPSYLSGGAGPDPNERAASSSSSGRRGKFGPPVAGKKIFDVTQNLRCLVLKIGNALARVQRVHKPLDPLGHHLLHLQILRLLVLLKPADFKAQSSLI